VRHQCAIGPSKIVRQERALGTLKADRVIHTNTDDCVMNLGQFRSAMLISSYRTDHPFYELSLESCAELGYEQREKNRAETRTKCHTKM
jgi:hypothetical protein